MKIKVKSEGNKNRTSKDGDISDGKQIMDRLITQYSPDFLEYSEDGSGDFYDFLDMIGNEEGADIAKAWFDTLSKQERKDYIEVSWGE